MIIWPQGIWLILHGYALAGIPLWAGIYLLPLTAGFVVAGPATGWLWDRYGGRWFASGGLLVCAAAFGGLLLPSFPAAASVKRVMLGCDHPAWVLHDRCLPVYIGPPSHSFEAPACNH